MLKPAVCVETAVLPHLGEPEGALGTRPEPGGERLTVQVRAGRKGTGRVVAARSVGVEKIDARGGRASFTFAPSTSVAPEHILKVIAQSRGKMALRKEYTLDVRIPAEPWPAVRDALSAVLGSLR